MYVGHGNFVYSELNWAKLTWTQLGLPFKRDFSGKRVPSSGGNGACLCLRLCSEVKRLTGKHSVNMSEGVIDA